MKVSGNLYWVKSLDDSREFYEKLGFAKKDSGDDWVELTMGQFDLMLLQMSGKKGDEFKKDEYAEQKGLGMYLYIQVENVDDTHTKLQDKGLEPSTEPRDWEWGSREFVIKDPDGFKVVFWHTIPSK